MMLKSCSVDDILHSSRNYNHIRYEIEAFATSNAACAEIDVSRYKSASSAASTWRRSVQRCGLEHEVKIIQNGDRVFIADAWAL